MHVDTDSRTESIVSEHDTLLCWRSCPDCYTWQAGRVILGTADSTMHRFTEAVKGAGLVVQGADKAYRKVEVRKCTTLVITQHRTSTPPWKSLEVAEVHFHNFHPLPLQPGSPKPLKVQEITSALPHWVTISQWGLKCNGEVATASQRGLQNWQDNLKDSKSAKCLRAARAEPPSTMARPELSGCGPRVHLLLETD